MIRIWVEKLGAELTQTQCHYLFKVMRKKPGDQILIFNQEEWLVSLSEDCKSVNFIKKTREITTRPIKSLAIGCIKKPRMEFLVEKTTEVGVDNIYLLDTEYSQRTYYNFDRLDKIAIEATEQSGRLCVPKIHPPQKLQDFLKHHTGQLLLCYQNSEIEYKPDSEQDLCCLVGPEGGWSANELQIMGELPKIKLNENILRAETAAIIAMGLFLSYKT